jgi:hypothetical protein
MLRAAQRLFSNRRSKFLIVSNMRSGSTWLETALGALPDVFTDFEFKCGVTYQPSAVHYVLTEQTPQVTDVLEGMASTAPVTGSKFVFDRDLTRREIMGLQAKLGQDVRLIHLTRSYRDVFLSRRRGFYHLLNVAKSAAIGQYIKTAILEAEPPSSAPSTDAQIVGKFACFEELRQYIQNDESVALLRASGRPYFHVKYDEINNKLPEIAQFIESAATPAEIAETVANPPVLKLPKIAPASLVANIDELEPLFELAEAMRFNPMPAPSFLSFYSGAFLCSVRRSIRPEGVPRSRGTSRRFRFFQMDMAGR